MSHDRTSSMFFLAVSIIVIRGVHTTGAGYYPSARSRFYNLRCFRIAGDPFFGSVPKDNSKERFGGEALFRGILWWRVLFSGLAILAFALVMPTLGYLTTTFLLMLFLYFMIHEQKWYWVIISSLLSSLASYYLFSKLLNCQFPDGLFGL